MHLRRWCRGLSQVRAAVTAHRDSWITEADFAMMADNGINAVRLPVGYWALARDGRTGVALRGAGIQVHRSRHGLGSEPWCEPWIFRPYGIVSLSGKSL